MVIWFLFLRKESKVKFKNYDNPKKSLDNIHYDCQYTRNGQSFKNIKSIVRKAPFDVYYEDKHENVYSFLVPHWTVCMFVENGWLCASNVPVSISIIHKDFDENTNLQETNGMSELYVFEDIPKIKKIAKLDGGLKQSFTPKIYAVTKYNDLVLKEKLKLSKLQLKQLKEKFNEQK